MNLVNLDGRLIVYNDALMQTDNSASRYGYGLFETMLVEDGTIRLAAYHWERLFSGLVQLTFHIPTDFTPDTLSEAVLATVKGNGLEKRCRVRLQVFGTGDGLYGLENKKLHYLIACAPLAAHTGINEHGLKIGTATGLSKSADSLSNLKSCSALIYAMAAQQAQEQQWDDALVRNTKGNIIESSIANIFWIKDDVTYTPPLADGCVAGVMRRYIMSTVPVREASLTNELLLDADEVFLTNAVRGIKWVGSIGGKRYGHKKTQAIYGLCQGK